ncbi:putative mitochondrial protein, partial [Mucuna pruriens]
MTNLGLLSYFLGMEFVTRSDGISMHQKRYAIDILKRFHMLDCNFAQTPIACGTKLEKEESDKSTDATLLLALRFLCGSKPNIAYGVGLISRFMDHSRLARLLEAKRILKYVKGTLDYRLLFSKHGRNVFNEK